MNIIVQKFGGTSLNSQEKVKSAITNIKKIINEKKAVIVIVSAIGRKESPYSTDALLNFLGPNPKLSYKERDKLIACGEIISAVSLSNNLKMNGMKSEAVDAYKAGIITDNQFGKSSILKINKAYLLKLIKNGIIPIVTGFQGITEKGDITTFGRGGSDMTASVIAAAFSADYIEIFKDVEGLKTADPNEVIESKLINKVDYKEIFEMANQGAKIIFPEAVEIAQNNDIPIYIRHIFTGEKETQIYHFNHKRPITGISCKENILFIRLKPHIEYQKDLIIFRELADNNISADFIDIRPTEITFIVDERYKTIVNTICEKKEIPFAVLDSFIKISLVGTGMTGVPGIMAKIIEIFNQNNIRIYQTTDSHTTISCLISKKDKHKAIKALHNGMFDMKLQK